MSNKTEEKLKQLIQDLSTNEKLAPWKNPYLIKNLAPKNASTGKHYHGLNAYILSIFGDHFLTFNQARQLKAYVKAGSKALPVFFFTNVDSKEENEKGEKEKGYCILKYYNVFNLSDIEINKESSKKLHALKNRTELNLSKHVPSDQEQDAKLQEILLRLNIQVKKKLAAPSFYMPALDEIHLASTHTQEQYNQVLAHEMIHWTGHKDRLNRLSSDGKGSKSYAKEELIAESGSIVLLERLGLSYDYQSSLGYLDGWMKNAKANPKTIFSLIKQIKLASDFLTGQKEAENDIVEETHEIPLERAV